MENAVRFLQSKHIPVWKKEEISFVGVSDSNAGAQLAYDLLLSSTDRKTVLFLSGASTPMPLYEIFAKDVMNDGGLDAGAVAMVDERYGKPYHQESNELAIKNTGFLKFLDSRDIPFHQVLGLASREELAQEYDQTVRMLLQQFPKSAAVLGMGADGHTAGLPAGIQDLKLKTRNLVEEFDNFPGPQRERITLTFEGFSQIDFLLVLVFGEEKKKALELMFAEGPEEEIPARFFKREEIAKKTLFITDQKI